MKRIFFSLFLFFATFLTGYAQVADSTMFKGYLQNKEYNVYMQINFYDQDVVISWEDMYGSLPGFLAKEGGNFCWIITDVSMEGRQAQLEMVNDYGSEDLTATLTQVNDSIYTLRQRTGSTIKVPNNGKWQKLPSTLSFTKRKTKK